MTPPISKSGARNCLA